MLAFVITCDESNSFEHQNHADGVLVKMYIENTKCMIDVLKGGVCPYRQ